MTHEPILKPGETVDYFDIWHALMPKCTSKPAFSMPAYVERWAARSESRTAHLQALRDTFSMNGIFLGGTPSDDVEMISRMLTDINSIVYEEQTVPQIKAERERDAALMTESR